MSQGSTARRLSLKRGQALKETSRRLQETYRRDESHRTCSGWLDPAEWTLRLLQAEPRPWHVTGRFSPYSDEVVRPRLRGADFDSSSPWENRCRTIPVAAGPEY